MDKRDEFDLEFDFDKEYDYNPNEILDDEQEESALEFDIPTSFDGVEKDSSDAELDELLSDEFMASLGIELKSESSAEPEEALPEVSFPEDDDVKEYKPAPEPAFEVEPELGEEFTAAFEKDFPSEEAPAEAEGEQPAAPVAEAQEDSSEPKPPRRRRKLSKERIIKEVYLPPIIAGLALILIISFIGSAIGRAIKNSGDAKDKLDASNAASSGALQQEADLILAEAEALANGYDYDAAIAKLDSLGEDLSQFKTLVDKRNAYSLAKDALKPIDDPASIPNLSFHCLIADPARAFTDESFGDAFNKNYVTIDEFSKILQQLYDKGYVLVDYDSFIVETTSEDGKTTYSTQPIYLPADKKPIMLTETLVNYELFTVDSDDDLEADKGGSGFASKLIVDTNGEITCEMVDANGNTVTGAYDLVPILENFLKEHPDFSYRGARAILAVSGEDGVFGYRIMHSVKESKGEDYYNQQVEGAKQIAQALRDAGYTIACYTYANVSYGAISATAIQADLDNWKKEVKPVLGQVDYLVYAKGSDISADGGYNGSNKYNVLKDAGFRYFISSGSVPYAEVNAEYVRQSRIMVTGEAMSTSSTAAALANYFDAKSVLNELRGS